MRLLKIHEENQNAMKIALPQYLRRAKLSPAKWLAVADSAAEQTCESFSILV